MTSVALGTVGQGAIGRAHVHCRRIPGAHGRYPHYLCDYCSAEAVFHWRATYPDLLLCAACLQLYPEALGRELGQLQELPPVPFGERR